MQDKLIYINSTLCHICNEELGEDKCVIIFICLVIWGAADEVCNLRYKIPQFFPFVFHNLSGYGSHLLIKTLGNSEGDISCIPNSEENYISFKKQVIVDKFVNNEGKEVNVKRELRFIDSLRFMAASPDSFLVIWKLTNLLTWRNTMVVIS